jgi:hypothetical protein
MPSTYAVELGGIALRGTMPLMYRKILGDEHHRASFRAMHRSEDEPGDAHVDIMLHGPSPERQVHLQSDDQPVEFGQHKKFTITHHGAKEPHAQLDCEDVCIMLDDYIPNAGQTFMNLVDPRQANTFDRIALSIGDSLRQKAKQRNVRHSYNSMNSRLSRVGNIFYELESGARLSITEENDATTLGLNVTSALDIDNKRIGKMFTYSFDATPWRSKGFDTRPVESTAKIHLVSAHMSQQELARYLPSSQEDAEGYALARNGLLLIRHEYFGR